MAEKRIISAVAQLCSLPEDGVKDQLEDNNDVEKFCDNASCQTLYVQCTGEDGNQKIHVTLQAPESKEDESVVGVQFVKTKEEELNEENFAQCVMVSSTSSGSSSLQSLYQTLKTVYAPVILESHAWTDKLDRHTQTSLTELEAQLGQVMRRGSVTPSLDAVHSQEALATVVTPLDEIQVWKSLQGSPRLSECAGRFYDALAPLEHSFQRIHKLSLAEVHALLDPVAAALHSVWTARLSSSDVYPQERMKHTFNVFGEAINRYLYHRLDKVDPWKGRFSEVLTTLKEARVICLNFDRKLKALTKCKEWTGARGHEWKGGEFKLKCLKPLVSRLNDVIQCRSIWEELNRTLGDDDKAEFTSFDPFVAFAKMHPFRSNMAVKKQWKHAKEVFEEKIKAPVSKANKTLRPVLSGVKDAQRTVQFVLKVKNLLRRKDVQKGLDSERNDFAGAINSYSEQLFEKAKSIPEAPPSSLRVISRQLAAGLRIAADATRCSSCLSFLFGDCDKTAEALKNLEAVTDFVKSVNTDTTDEWMKEVEALLKGDLAWQTQGKLVIFNINEGGVFSCTTSKLLHTFLREVRFLAENGFVVGSKVTAAAIEAQSFLVKAVEMSKVANLYNLTLRQALPTQRPLLLGSIDKIRTVILGAGNTSGRREMKFKSSQSFQDFADRVRQAVEQLSQENRVLRQLHSTVGERVIRLMNIPLLRDRETWKAEWLGLSSLVTESTKSYQKERLTKWKLHWDHQMYKALQSAYQMGLESLDENTTIIECELVFSQRQLQFRPPLEELRQHYYKEMRKFIGIPNSFNGFGNGSIYRRMSSTNGRALRQVYRKADYLFQGLVAQRDKLKNWTALGSLKSIDDFVAERVTTVQEWDVNFKMVKKRRRDAQTKLQDEYINDCFKIDAKPFKSAVDDQMSALHDALVISLKASLSNELNEIEDFLDNSMEMLLAQPNSIEEIGNAKAEWKRIAEFKGEMKILHKRCEEKRKLLMSVADGSIDIEEVRQRLAALPDRMDTFNVAMKSFDDMVNAQKDKLREKVLGSIADCENKTSILSDQWDAKKPQQPEEWTRENVAAVFEELQDWQQQLEEIDGMAETLRRNCVHFEMDTPEFAELDALKDKIAEHTKMWKVLSKYNAALDVFGEQDWITFRSQLYLLLDFVADWPKKLKKEEPTEITQYVAEQIELLGKCIPILKNCKGDIPFTDAHWGELFRKLGIPKSVRLATLTAGHFFAVLDNVVKNDRFCRELTTRATAEVRLEEAMAELRDWCMTQEFTLLEHVELGRLTMVITDWKPLLTNLGDNQSLLGSLKDSSYFKPFAAEAGVFEKNFENLNTWLGIMIQIQRKWLYLEPIFMRGALPQEQARFRRVDDEFTEIQGKIAEDPHVINLCDENIHVDLGGRLEMCLDQLDRCQKALSDYLEQKRGMMPRFYFIGDDDLLEILGQAQNPAVIQQHLKKLFQGVQKVGFNEDQTAITSILSSAKEEVQLLEPVMLSEQVEQWLTEVVKQMKNSLKVSTEECLAEDDPDKAKFSSQVLCLTEQVHFTNRCEEHLKNGTLAPYLDVLRGTLKVYTSMDLVGTPLLRKKVMSLLIDLMHLIDVVDLLIRERTSDLDDWMWTKQLRFYKNEEGFVVVRMVDAELNYTYEYQGNAGKLVHTPLTDKCYLTLTQGMHQGYGGNPYGPAGTGKTESVKMLGATLGRQVLVFNCDEGIDFKSMGRIIMGLVRCGAWGCFDEFNRLKEDQLSAVSQQIQVVQDAIKFKKPECMFMGIRINVDFNSAIFVTMNPAGKKYGGRSKLPDNLKTLFRPVAMSRPDNDLIAEVMLYAEGFQAAKKLSTKVVAVFSLSQELLSPQQHYDWGLRGLKAILVTGGKLIVSRKAAGLEVNDVIEADLLVKALRVNTLSKLTFDDAKRFVGLCKDVFPEVDAKDIEIPVLEKAIKEVMESPEFNLIFDEFQMKRMLQLKESLEQRMGCVIVGPSGCGKTVVWKVLCAALRKTGKKLKTHVMNPKAMPRQQLLGFMDMDTREWNDGVLTQASKAVVKEEADVTSWIICDGDVDPEWIESLNSVLDDNHLLTLPSGERINFGPNVNFIFETHDLQFASPATISRCGMIFLSEKDVDVKKNVSKWVEDQPEDMQAKVTEWIDQLLYKALDWVLEKDSFVVESTMVGTVMNALSKIKGCKNKPDFVVGLVNGMGANLLTSDRKALGRKVCKWANVPGDVADHILDTIVIEGEYQRLGAQASNDIKDRSAIEKGIAVQTVSFQRSTLLVKTWYDRNEPFLLVGPEGCGKSMVLMNLFAADKKTSVTTLNCNSQTTADNVIQKLEEACTLTSAQDGRVYRPKTGDKLVLYLKNINLPKPDMYNSCMLIDFLQQLLTFKGYYNANLEFLRVENVHIVCSMNPPTTVGRNPISTRFTAIIKIAYIDYPSSDELVDVYTAYAGAALNSITMVDDTFHEPASQKKLAEAMVGIYTKFKEAFSINEHRHYLLTPRELTRWVKGLLGYDLEAEELLRVFCYEAQRLIADRLVDQPSKTKFQAMFSKIIRKLWPEHNADEAMMFSTFQPENEDDDDEEEEEGKNGVETKEGDEDAAKPAAAQKLLRKIPPEEFLKLAKRGLIVYEREIKELNIHLFDEVLEHMTQVDRILAKPGGSILVAGRAGVGRQTSIAIVANMHNMMFAVPEVTREYTRKRFFGTLKRCYEEAALGEREVVLFIEDYHMEFDFVLECVNSILSSGDVPGLFTSEDLAPLMDSIKEKMEETGAFGIAPYTFFIQQVVKRLHVVLSMDPTNELFARRCQSNPALFNVCNIVWMGSWRKDSMLQVPSLLLPVLVGEDDPNNLARIAVDIHQSCASVGEETSIFNEKTLTATPRNFVSLLMMHKKLYNEKKDDLINNANRMEGGLSKLQEAAVTVDELTTNAIAKRKVLAEKQKMADQAMTEITEALEGATERRATVEELTEQIAEKTEILTVQKADIEQELAEVKPLLEEAAKAVGGISTKDLGEIKSLKTPPEPIRDVLSGVLTLLGNKDTSWSAMKTFLGKRGVIDSIKNFDAHTVNKKHRMKCAKILKEKARSFDPAIIIKVSKAAAPLASWVNATVKFSIVIERVEPLTKKLEDATKFLDESAGKLAANQAELDVIDQKVAKLKDDFAQLTSEAEQLRVDLEKTEITLDKAQNLLGKLDGERTRWEVTAGELRDAVTTLPVKILLAAAYTTYLGKSSEDVRAASVKIWRSFSKTKRFDYREMLSTESELLEFKARGLPSDILSMENSLIILNSESRCPFIIDPASSATDWLTNQLALDDSRPLEVVPAADPRFVNKTELAVRFGKTLVILEVDSVEPMLVPLVKRDFSNQGSRRVVQIGDKLVDFNMQFRMYLVTRNPRPHLPPDTKAIITEVNFSVTRAGLEGQLLGVTLQSEKPELEKQKSEMLQKEEDCKVQIAALESKLLMALASSEGNLLENQELIDTLTETKVKAAEIKVALEAAQESSIELDQQRMVYQPFASEATQMYFLVQKMIAANHMYQFSLAAFLVLFKRTLKGEYDAEEVEDRVRMFTPDLEKRVLFYVGRGLYKADRLMWAVHLVHGMHEEIFGEGEWALMMGDVIDTDADGGEPKGFPSWATEDRHSAFRVLDSACPEAIDNLQLDDGAWKKFATEPECEQHFPPAVLKKATHVQQLLAVMTFRPDRMLSALNRFCCNVLKLPAITPSAVQLSSIFENETSSTLPVLMLTTTGMDPSKEILELATVVVGTEKYSELAMGGGQQELAMKMLGEAMKNGTWLCLKNLHLVVAWLPNLEKALSSTTPHPDFRLWLTTEAHVRFPAILLQSSYKMTFESPPGIKKNLQNTYTGWKPEYISLGSKQRARCLFLLAYFHAIIQERRNYIPQGWTEAYEFSPADLRVAANVVEANMGPDATAAGLKLTWELFHGMLENALYGGRISNQNDMRVLRAYEQQYFNDDMMAPSAELIKGGGPMPDSTSRDDYWNFIEALPDSDGPDAFGLPRNIERASQKTKSEIILKQLKSLEAAGGGSGGGFDRAKWKALLGPSLDSWDRLSANPAALGNVKGGAMPDDATPVQLFVEMEYTNAVKLVTMVDADVRAIRSVVYDGALVTPAILKNAGTMMTGWVPGKWERQWEGPEAPLPWLQALLKRKIALKDWRKNCMTKGKILSTPIDLGHLLHPGTFLNGVRQQTARQTGVALDALKQISCWDRRAMPSEAKVIVEVTGLMLQGCVFGSDGKLAEAASDELEMVKVDNCFIAFVPPDVPGCYPEGQYTSTPVYYNTTRERLLTSVAVPITSHEQKWVRLGAALFIKEL